MILLKYNDFVIQNDQSETKLQHRETILDIYITLQLLSQNQHYITITCILESNALHYNYIVLYQRNIYTMY
jgi:hypothetical protein